MLSRSVPILAALVLAAGVAAASAQPPRDESARENVLRSQQYERLLCTNPAFRKKRMAEECGPLTDPQLHQQCLESFRCNGGPTGARWRDAPPSETIR